MTANYEGRLLAAIRTTGEGSITVIFTTDGGEEARVMIRAVWEECV